MLDNLTDNAPKCYFEPSQVNIIVATFLILGTSLSYVPQYIAIIRAKSSDGINFLMLAIGLMSGFLTAVNSGILKWPSIVCCLDLSSVQCIKNNLATEQLLSALCCTIVLYLLFVIYFPVEETATESHKSRLRRKRTSMITLIAVCLGAVAVSIVCGVLYYDIHLRGTVLVTIAQVLGITSSVLMVVQWAPQIYTTFRMRDPGSLSVLMLILQMPGALLVMFFQAILNQSDVTTWAPYAFLFIEQLILVIMCAVFAFQKRRRSKTNRISETQKLLVEDGTISNYQSP